jgi:hypothetical protein
MGLTRRSSALKQVVKHWIKNKIIMSKHIKILTSSSIIINRIASILHQNNIQTLIKDNIESARLAGFGTSQNDVELFVDESDLENAQKIINEFRQENSI